eukprot:gnl/TRDRNA2_/TRDRNA2_182737_c0_seq1.p1 gnl/TRDRNA2_/TRDRNA2_182737_c0~~gnl/TRDRNA2_/TRDRNA2_182737_c0_seq1.p1  ORF type:complete len:361 (+),score=81.22 gnl/TRDRNA2_/TRDRNA2_182737_c0_seq1:32-1084(+)
MSFAQLQNVSKGAAVAGCKQPQPKQRRDEDSEFERSIKANIQEMQGKLRLASDNLERMSRTIVSNRTKDSIGKSLEQGRELIQKTEQVFRDWTVHLAGDPAERHRKKFSMERLRKAFDQEVEHMKGLSRKASAVQSEAAADDSAKVRSTQSGLPVDGNAMYHEQSTPAGDNDEEHGLLHDVDTRDIANRIAAERDEGIRRIQSAVSEVNGIFRDIASIVQEQGQHFQTIEQQAETASVRATQAVVELKKAAKRPREKCDRICFILAGALLLLVIVLLPHAQKFSSQTINSTRGPFSAPSPLEPWAIPAVLGSEEEPSEVGAKESSSGRSWDIMKSIPKLDVAVKPGASIR